jgi:hypothetical protein
MPLFKTKSAYHEANDNADAAPASNQPRPPTSAADWARVRDDLQAKIEQAQAQIAQMEGEQASLSLDAELGSAEARQRIVQLGEEIHVRQRESALTVAAMGSARRKLHEAQQREAAEQEADRRRQIVQAVGQCVVHVQAVDAAMRHLAAELRASRESLDEALNLMTSAERLQVQMLLRPFGPTMAACYFGLNRFLDLGQTAMHHNHYQTLESFTRPYLDANEPRPRRSSTLPKCLLRESADGI